MRERTGWGGGKRERERYPDCPGAPETRQSVCLIWGGVGLAPLVHNIHPFSPNIFISKRDTILFFFLQGLECRGQSPGVDRLGVWGSQLV